MCKVIYMLVAVVSLTPFSEQVYIQRYLLGMEGVELRGGFAEDSKSPLNHYAGFAVSGYTKKTDRWIVGAEYLLKNYGYRNVSVPRVQFATGGGYYLRFLSDPSKTLFLSVDGPVLVGHEAVNWGNKMLCDGSKLPAKGAFICGGAITLELETYVTDRIVLLASARGRAMWGDSLSVFTTQFGLGVKFIISQNITAYEYKGYKENSHYRFSGTGGTWADGPERE